MREEGARGPRPVVIAGLFFLFLLRKHFITEIFFKKKTGDVNDEANFSFFILLHKRAKPILPKAGAEGRYPMGIWR